MGKTFIGKSSGEVLDFFAQYISDYAGEGISLPGTDYIIGPDAADWIAAQAAEGKALAMLEAARQEGVIGSYCLHSPSPFCDQWQAGTYVTGRANGYEKGATAAAALTAAADKADSLRVPPMPGVSSMDASDCILEMQHYKVTGIKRDIAHKCHQYWLGVTLQDGVELYADKSETVEAFFRRALTEARAIAKTSSVRTPGRAWNTRIADNARRNRR